MRRESGFPLRLMEKGYDFQIELAQASREDDKRNIMNSITKQPLDSTPDPSDEAFSRVSRTLRSMLAEHAARHSAEAGQLQKAVEFLCGDEERKKLTLNFYSCSQLSDVSALAALGGLQNIAQLNLYFGGCLQLSDANVRGLRGLAERAGFNIEPDPRRSKCCAIQ